jgi:hypothetical protein
MQDTPTELPVNEVSVTENESNEPAPAPHLDYAIENHAFAAQNGAAAKFLRGPLKYDVDTSSPQLEAGKAFSLFVRVTNPYESAVSLLDISASLPTEFRDKDNQDTGLWRAIKQQAKEEIRGKVVVAQNVTAPDAIASGKEQSGVLATVPGETLLQHGNSSLKRFTLKTWRSTLFMPAAYILQFQVRYKIDGILNLDTIRQELNIRAPLGAVLQGALWGAVVGSVLHSLYLTGFVFTWSALGPFFQQTFAGILLGGVLVVAFARKKDAQPFISIEDFYGGFFVGFSAGYVGKVLLNKILPQ